jgi:hypothetical protein
MKGALFFFSLIILSISSFCQRNFKPATIKFPNGDTAVGEINYQNWRTNPSTIVFRKDAGSKVVTYGPETLAAFSVEDDSYQSGTVDIDDRFDDIGRLDFEEKIITQKSTVFLKTIITGKKPLYHYFDNVEHFYIINNDTFELLQYKKYKTHVVNARSENVSNSLQTNRNYIYQLFQYLDDCPAMKRKLAETLYDLRSMKQAFLAYYKCTGAAPESVPKEEVEKGEFGLLAGASRTEFNSHSKRGAGPTRLDFPVSTNFAGGVFYDLIFPRGRGRISFNSELLYSSFKSQSEWRTSESSTRFDSYHYTFGKSYLKLNNMLRYRILVGAPTIFLNVGISNTAAIAKTSTLEKHHKFDEYESTTSEAADKAFGTYDFAMIAGGGIKVGRVSLEVRGEKGTSTITTFDGEATVIKFFALLGFRLK